MRITHTLLALATAATLGSGCSRYGSAAGDVGTIAPEDAANTAVLIAKNLSNDPIELRTVALGQSRYIGSVAPGESTSILLDPTLLPSGDLYIVGIPASGRGRALSGPLAVAKGNKIQFTIQPSLSTSRAYVVP